MFKNNTMTVVTDLNTIGPDINNIDFVSIAAVTTSFPNLPNIYNASILMPPTELLMQWADGDRYVLQSQYPLYLKSQMPDEMLVAIISVLTKRNVILYIPSDDFNVFGQMLLNHIYFEYGIVCNTPSTTYSIDMTRMPYLISKFYMIDVMNAKDYLDCYPSNALLPEFVINKLAMDLHPFDYQATFQQYADYFNKLNSSTMGDMKSMVEYVGDMK